MNRINKYIRQTSIPEIGPEGQKRLGKSKVFVVGCGALGSMIAMQLAGAGIGKLGIADFDTIDITNLQRQFFFKSSEAGKSKAELTGFRIRELNPETEVEVFKEIITPAKAERYFGEYDIIVDGTDNPDSKKMIGTVCQLLNKPCCIGGVSGFMGQVMIFPPSHPRFEEYFGDSGPEGFLPCSLGGVMGPSAVLCASVQASETILYLLGLTRSFRTLVFNLRDLSFIKLLS